MESKPQNQAPTAPNETAEALRQAILSSDINKISQLLIAGVSPNGTNAMRPLQTAIVAARPMAVALLLEEGADLLLADREGAVPLFAAVENALSERAGSGNMSIFWDIAERMTPRLANARDSRGRTPLMAIAQAKCLNLARAVLSHTDLSLTDNAGLTAFDLFFDKDMGQATLSPPRKKSKLLREEWAVIDKLAGCASERAMRFAADPALGYAPELAPRLAARLEAIALREAVEKTTAAAQGPGAGEGAASDRLGAKSQVRL